MPAEVAWSFLSVYANDVEWRQGVSRMDQTPAGPVVDGASAVEHLRMFGRDLVNVALISDVQAGASFTWQVKNGADAHGSRRVVPVGLETCEIIIDKAVRLDRADRWLRPIVALVLRRTERADLRRVAHLLEDRARQ